jgi:four helix bundle protein
MAKFLQIGMGSASEMEYELLLARDLGYLEETAYLGLHASVSELEKMLASLLRKVRADDRLSLAKS